MRVPSALAYVGIVGVDPVVGLCTVPLALAAYAMFGTSPLLVVGPDAAISVLAAATPLLQGDHGGPIRIIEIEPAEDHSQMLQRSDHRRIAAAVRHDLVRGERDEVAERLAVVAGEGLHVRRVVESKRFAIRLRRR